MDVTTLAGSTQGHQDGQGAAAQFNGPDGVACCPDGSAFVAEYDGHCIRAVSAGGAVATFAGSGAAGFLDGQGTAARFNAPRQVARDAAGNLYVADTSNHRIRKVTPAGLVTTFAGTGAAGNEDGRAQATFNNPCGVAVSPRTGNVIVADTLNHRIRVITVPDNVVYTLAGGAAGFADGPLGAAQFYAPFHVACDTAGNVYVADQGNDRVRKITLADGQCAVATLAGDGTAGHQDGEGAQARFDRLYGIAVDGSGNVLVTQLDSLRMVTPTGTTSTLVGDGTRGHADGQGTAARFRDPVGIAVDAAGRLVVADAGNHRLRRVAAGLAPPASVRAPEPEVPAVVANLAKLLDEGESTYHDIEFLVGGETIRAHKGILAAQCEYFATMLGSGFAEGTGDGGVTSGSGGGGHPAPLTVADTTAAAFRAVLRFLYTGAVELEEASVLDVTCLSQRYLVTALHEQCLAYCAANVSPANAVGWLIVADAHAIVGLRATLLEYVADNLAEIKAAVPDTQATLEAHPRLMFACFDAATSSPAAERRTSGN